MRNGYSIQYSNAIDARHTQASSRKKLCFPLVCWRGVISRFRSKIRPNARPTFLRVSARFCAIVLSIQVAVLIKDRDLKRGNNLLLPVMRVGEKAVEDGRSLGAEV